MGDLPRQSSNDAFLGELGARIQRRRLELDLTRELLADRAGVGVSTLQRIEGGRSTQVVSLLRVLGALGFQPQVESWLPSSERSPLGELERGGRERRRASRRRTVARDDRDWTWGDGQ